MPSTELSVFPGVLNEFYYDLYSNNLITFTVTEESNIYAVLSDLGVDLDLYLVRLNSDGSPEIDSDGDVKIFNSSTNSGTQDDVLFAQLPPGDYYYMIENPLAGRLEFPESLNYSLTIDAKTFDETTRLSDDPYLPQQWHLFNTGITSDGDIGINGNQWISAPNADIGAPEAWKINTDASEIVIAIIDTGVDTSHPDLITNLWTNSREIPGNGVDDDGNGYVDDIHGWNFVDNSSKVVVNEETYHGTHVAGIAGAQGNNGIGVSGVAWNTQLMALDVFNGEKSTGFDPNGNSADVSAIYYAVDNGAKVINMSLGENIKMSPEVYNDLNLDPAYRAAFQYAYDNDVFVSLSAGNEGDQLSDKNQWKLIGNKDIYTSEPAVYSNEFGNIASVGSSQAQNRISDYSNYGQSISIFAPGGDGGQVIVDQDEFGRPTYASTPDTLILSTVPTGTGSVDSDYGYAAGTSMSAPVIAGIAALIRAEDSSITAPETLAILRAGAIVNPYLIPYGDQGLQANLYSSLEIARSWTGTDDLTQINQSSDTPIINLSFLTEAQSITGQASFKTDLDGKEDAFSSSGDDLITGFYRTVDQFGAVSDATGNSVLPGESGYAEIAISSNNLAEGLANVSTSASDLVDNDFTLSGGEYLAPYVIFDGEIWFAFQEANSDKVDHFQLLSTNTFGFERTIAGEGDQSFDDLIISFDSDSII